MPDTGIKRARCIAAPLNAAKLHAHTKFRGFPDEEGTEPHRSRPDSNRPRGASTPQTLLNNYTFAYHTAKLRKTAGQLDHGPDGRLLELAKLVCLRTEFPRFGGDLALSDRLPEYFRLIADGVERPKHVPATVWAVAASYFSELRGVETMLDTRSRDGATSQGVEVDESSQGNDGPEIATTRRAIKRQLDHYLQKTSRVQNPRRDLIFMEQLGHTYGLSSDLADQLEQIAVENRVRDARQVVQENPADNEAMLRFLSGLASQSFPGVEGDNVVTVLLAASDVAEAAAVEIAANEAVSAVMAHRRRSEFSEEDLPGALALALKANGADATELVSLTPTAASSPVGRPPVRDGAADAVRGLAVRGDRHSRLARRASHGRRSAGP